VLDAGIVNACYPERFRPAERARLQAARRQAKSQLAAAALSAALSEQARAQTQQEQLQRLRNGLGTELLVLPCLFSEVVGRAELEQLADGLEAGLARLESVPA
jgi:hypothetical protein